MIFLIISVISFGMILFLDSLVPDEKERTDDVFANNNDPAVDCHRKFCLLSDDLFKQLCAIDGSAAQDTIGNLYTWDFCDHKIQITAILKHGTPPKTYILYDNKITQQKKKFYKYEKFVEFFEQHNLELKQQILQYNLSKDFT
jgi:hypothetical protein